MTKILKTWIQNKLKNKKRVDNLEWINRELMEQISNYTIEVKDLTSKNKKLEKINKDLKLEIEQLEYEVDELIKENEY